MSFSFLPALLIQKLTDLTPEYLQSKGVRLLMLDFDNTIVPYTTDVPTDEMRQWLMQMQQSPVDLCIVSNSKNERVPRFCRAYGLDCITHAGKPFPGGIRRCLEKYGLPPKDCALAGDQIFTDTLGANGAGVMPILVEAIDNHNIWLRLRHIAELPFIYIARKRRMTHEELGKV